jgi:uncharacterized damage-inducible protein DinB
LSDEQFAGDLTYKDMAGTQRTLPRASLIHTLFTHGAHHRGQVTTVLHQLGKATPVLDFPMYLSELPAEQLRSV